MNTRQRIEALERLKAASLLGPSAEFSATLAALNGLEETWFKGEADTAAIEAEIARLRPKHHIRVVLPKSEMALYRWLKGKEEMFRFQQQKIDTREYIAVCAEIDRLRRKGYVPRVIPR